MLHFFLSPWDPLSGATYGPVHALVATFLMELVNTMCRLTSGTRSNPSSRMFMETWSDIGESLLARDSLMNPNIHEGKTPDVLACWVKLDDFPPLTMLWSTILLSVHYGFIFWRGIIMAIRPWMSSLARASPERIRAIRTLGWDALDVSWKSSATCRGFSS